MRTWRAINEGRVGQIEVVGREPVYHIWAKQHAHRMRHRGWDRDDQQAEESTGHISPPGCGIRGTRVCE